MKREIVTVRGALTPRSSARFTRLETAKPDPDDVGHRVEDYCSWHPRNVDPGRGTFLIHFHEREELLWRTARVPLRPRFLPPSTRISRILYFPSLSISLCQFANFPISRTLTRRSSYTTPRSGENGNANSLEPQACRFVKIGWEREN